MSDNQDPADLIANDSTHRDAGRRDPALANSDPPIALRPDAAEAFGGRVLADRHRNSVEAAIADHDRVLELDATNADALFKRSALHRLNGEFDRAAADFDRAIQFLWRQRERIELPPDRKTAETVAPAQSEETPANKANLGQAA